jgi:hypothetical protein
MYSREGNQLILSLKRFSCDTTIQLILSRKNFYTN